MSDQPTKSKSVQRREAEQLSTEGEAFFFPGDEQFAAVTIRAKSLEEAEASLAKIRAKASNPS